jgi:hypothetical protein
LLFGILVGGVSVFSFSKLYQLNKRKEELKQLKRELKEEKIEVDKNERENFKRQI